MGRKKKTHKRIFVPLKVYEEIVDGFENYDEVSIEAIMVNPVMIKKNNVLKNKNGEI